MMRLPSKTMSFVQEMGRRSPSYRLRFTRIMCPAEEILDHHRGYWVIALRQKRRRWRMAKTMEPEPADQVSNGVIRPAVLPVSQGWPGRT
jgi:hypothetical protein